MAKIWHCNMQSKATAYRLPSSKPEYRFQRLRHCPECKKCGKELMQWRGEYADGNKFTGWIDVPASEFPQWKRLIKASEARPKAQLVSDYSYRVAAGDIDIQIEYQTKLLQAQRQHKSRSKQETGRHGSITKAF